MEEKGINGDSFVYMSLVFVYFKVGKVGVMLDLLDKMYKRRLNIILKIYRCFNILDVVENNILGFFWDYLL